MAEDRCWYIKYPTWTGEVSHALIFGDKLHWDEKRQGRLLRKIEIPPEFHAFSLQDFINYFEHGIKPRRRIGYEGKNYQGSDQEKDR